MANDINSVVINGRLTRDSEVRYTNSGTAICKFSIASNKRVKSGEEWGDKASFFDIILWGKQGEALSQYLTKGQQVSVAGELVQNRWEQDGQKRSKVEINASNVQLVGAKTEQRTNPAVSMAQNVFNNPQGVQKGAAAFEDDIPF